MLAKNNSPIVKCSHCKRILSVEDFDSHECDLPLTGVKRIPVVYFQDDSVNGEKIMTGSGVDGVLYSFVVTPRTAIPYILEASDEILHDHKSDKDFTEPFSIMFISYCSAALRSVKRC